jgi:hypothetical protein
MVDSHSKSFITRPEVKQLLMAKKGSIKDYLDYTCDVEALATIKLDTESSKDLHKVVDYINKNLEYTPNARRQNIRIGDYLDNDTKLNLEFINGVADSVLTQKALAVADKAFVYQEVGLDVQGSYLLSNDIKSQISSQISTQKHRKYDSQTLQPFERNLTTDEAISKNLENGT